MSKKPRIQIDYEKVANLAGRGLTKEDIAHCLGISPRTLFSRQNDDKRFKKAMEAGHAQAIAAVTGKLMAAINTGNMTGIIFWLKCRAGWKETSIVMNADYIPPAEVITTPEEGENAYKSLITL